MWVNTTYRSDWRLNSDAIRKDLNITDPSRSAYDFMVGHWC
jgi:hypothetical protein